MIKPKGTALVALLMILIIALACEEEASEAPSEQDSKQTEIAETERSSTEPESSDDDYEPEAEETLEEVEEDIPAATPRAPERIRFGRGMTQGRITLDLRPYETRSYVVGVGPAQYFHIGLDDERPSIVLTNASRLSEINRGSTFLDGITTDTGDIRFQIRNTTQNPIRTFALVTIKDREPMDH